MSIEKKNLFDKAIDALTTRDEREAAGQAQAVALAAQKEAAVLRARLADEKTATARALAENAALEKAAVEKATAEKAAAVRTAVERTMAERAAAMKAAQQASAAAARKGLVRVRSLRIRRDHDISSEVVAGLVDGNEVVILDTWSDGQNTWGRLENGWVAMVYEGETYIKVG